MSNNPTQKTEWQKLTAHAKEIEKTSLRQLFAEDKKRAENFSLSCGGLFFDYSKQRITKETIDKLCALATAANIEGKRDSLFNGDNINTTENRPALHTALRDIAPSGLSIDGTDVTTEIQEALNKIESLSGEIRNGQFMGATGKVVKHVVALGVGGSDLGPRLVCHALRNTHDPADGLHLHFVSNIDGNDLGNVLPLCSAERTVFIVVSKSFSTQETITNAQTAKDWLRQNLPKNSDVSAHFIGISTNKKRALSFGIKEENFLPIWDWVNGRFSLWSAVGLPIAIQYGFDVFEELLRGANDMDTHFKTAPLSQNIPVIMALIGIWNRNFLNMPALAILPYAENLSLLPDYLQQLEMESNGKNIDLDGNKIEDYQTAPILFGQAGTKGQHSFYQLLHQGTQTIPCDFIGYIQNNNGMALHHNALLDNMLAQGQALTQGRDNNTDLHRHFDGNKPSTAILLKKLDAYSLGMLLALYEHKCFVQGVIWNINSFDQFGVDLGKELSLQIKQGDLSNADSSTSQLHSLIHKQGK